MLDSTTGGGGDTTDVPVTGDTAAATDLANAWGLSYALLNDPVYGNELKNVLDLLNKKDYAGARKALENSKFYKNNSSTVAARLKMKASQPGAYADALDKYKTAQKKRLTAAGVKIDPNKIDAILQKAYESGLDDNQLDSSILANGQYAAKFGGSTLGQVDSLKQYANAYGMSYNDATWDGYSKDLFAGNTTAEDVQAKIRQDAASAFPAYADQINKGVSLDALASAYKSSYANILEVDPNSISYTDPKLRQALQFVDANGKPSIKPLWQFEQDLRNDPRWEYTNNARNVLDSMSMKVLRDWGLA